MAVVIGVRAFLLRLLSLFAKRPAYFSQYSIDLRHPIFDTLFLVGNRSMKSVRNECAKYSIVGHSCIRNGGNLPAY